MKSLLVLTTFMVSMSCGKDPEIRQSPPCIEMKTNPDFISIPFKKDYIIQVPIGSTGPGMVFSKGVQFSISTSVGSQLYYRYFCATDCDIYFGETLASPAPDTLIGFQGNPETLTKGPELCIAGDVQAILYYSKNPGSLTHGKLYMKRGQDFEEGLLINFDFANLSEIESILKTISN